MCQWLIGQTNIHWRRPERGAGQDFRDQFCIRVKIRKKRDECRLLDLIETFMIVNRKYDINPEL